MTDVSDPFRTHLRVRNRLESHPCQINSVLITGVNGFIAGHLAERLLRQGVKVRGTARRPEAAAWLEEQGVEIVQADLSGPQTR